MATRFMRPTRKKVALSDKAKSAGKQVLAKKSTKASPAKAKQSDSSYVSGVMARARKELGKNATKSELVNYAAKNKWVSKNNAAVKAYAAAKPVPGGGKLGKAGYKTPDVPSRVKKQAATNASVQRAMTPASKPAAKKSARSMADQRRALESVNKQKGKVAQTQKTPAFKNEKGFLKNVINAAKPSINRVSTSAKKLADEGTAKKRKGRA